MARATVGTLQLQVKRAGTEYDPFVFATRDTFRWTVTNTDTGETVSGDDLRSGAQGATPRQMLASLVSFLSADAETYAYRGGTTPEDGYIFGDQVAEWAYMNADELSMYAIEHEEN